MHRGGPEDISAAHSRVATVDQTANNGLSSVLLTQNTTGPSDYRRLSFEFWGHN